MATTGPTISTTVLNVSAAANEKKNIYVAPFASFVHPLLRKFSDVIIGVSFATLLFYPTVISSTLCIVIGYELRDLLGNNVREFVNNVLMDNPDFTSSKGQGPTPGLHRTPSSSEGRLSTLFNLGIAIAVFSLLETVLLVGVGISFVVGSGKDQNTITLIGLISGSVPIICIVHIGFVALVHHIVARCRVWEATEPIPGALPGNNIGALVTKDEGVTEILTKLNIVSDSPLADIPFPVQKYLALLYQSFIHTLSTVLISMCSCFALYFCSVFSAMMGIYFGLNLRILTHRSALSFYTNIQKDSVSIVSRSMGRRIRRLTCTIGCCASSIINIQRLSTTMIILSVLEYFALNTVVQYFFVSENPLSVLGWIVSHFGVNTFALNYTRSWNYWLPLVGNVGYVSQVAESFYSAFWFLWSFAGQLYIVVTYAGFSAVVWTIIDQIFSIPITDGPMGDTNSIPEWSRERLNDGNYGITNRNNHNKKENTVLQSPYYGPYSSGSSSATPAAVSSQDAFDSSTRKYSNSRTVPKIVSIDNLVVQVMAVVDPRKGDLVSDKDTKYLINRIRQAVDEVLDRNNSAVLPTYLRDKVLEAVVNMHNMDASFVRRLIIQANTMVKEEEEDDGEY